MLDDGTDGSAGPGDALGPEGGLSADRFVTGVVSFTPGPCAGFGKSEMPGDRRGTAHGGGASMGSLDVVSLGVAGEIVVSFAPNAIVDGPGADFIVFENPFYIGGDSMKPYAEPGEVSVSDDGTTWTTYPCTATSYPYGQCAGWHAVYSAPGNGISPVDPATAGGDAYDSQTWASPTRASSASGTSPARCAPTQAGSNADGFDLDAVSIVNAEMPWTPERRERKSRQDAKTPEEGDCSRGVKRPRATTHAPLVSERILLASWQLLAALPLATLLIGGPPMSRGGRPTMVSTVASSSGVKVPPANRQRRSLFASASLRRQTSPQPGAQ